MDDLHTTFHPILQEALASLSLPHSGLALDLASGSGQKHTMLHKALGQQVQIVALDIDQDALLHSKRLTLHKKLSGVLADAHLLPFRAQSFDIAFCLVALGLFRDQHQVLAELRRILKPGASLLLSMTEMRWCECISWSPDLARRLEQAYYPYAARWEHTLSAADDISAELQSLLHHAGFSSSHVRAFILGDAPPLQNELALLPWPALRPVVASRLSQPELRRCDAYAASPELVLCPMVMLARAWV